MSCTVVVGTQWGDEGKGKVIDLLAAEADVVVRFQGGGNAGHTVHVGDEKYVMHLVPCGILHPGRVNVIGNGVVVDPVDLVAEIDGLEKRGISVAGRLFISEIAHVTLPYHRRMDEAREALRGEGKIGTTHRGIGPTYSDKFGRVGIRMADLLDEDLFTAKVRKNLEEKNTFFRSYFGVPEVTEREVLDPYRKYMPRLKDMIVDTIPLLGKSLADGRRMLLEGAQGSMLDVDFGTYPYVTASNPTAGGACTGSGVPPTAIDSVIGVIKAYITRVGAGPFPTELPAEEEERLRLRGREYGATTGRPRRCGWFDAVVARRAAAVNGLTSLAVTKLDVLDQLDRIPVCVAYEYRGARLTEFPPRTEMAAECRPVYEEMPGWKTDTTGARRYEDLPAGARAYLKRLEELTGTRIGIVSVGPRRDETIRISG